MTQVPIRVVIADDHALIRDGLQVLLRKEQEIELCGEARDGEALVKLVHQVKPDVVITDVKMPGLDGVDATRQIKEAFPHIGVIGLSSHDEGNLIIDMIKAGAKSFLVKTASKSEILEAIRKVYRDETYYCPATREKLASIMARSNFHPITSSAASLFTERERQVINLTCEGLSNKQIAERLGLKPRTIDSYKETIMEKMGVNSSTAIVIYAVDNGLYKRH